MKKNLFVLGLLVCAMSVVAQTEKKESWYFKLGGSYFIQATATQFPVVGGQTPNRDVYVDGKLASRESITGSFGEGFRYGGNVGYRFTPRLGVEIGINYYNSNRKTMVETIDRVISMTGGPTYLDLTAEGQVKALDLAPAVVLFLGELKGFEPYSKVGAIVPVNGKLTIETTQDFNGPAVGGERKVFQSDKVKPNATVGFLAALGTSYKLAKNLSAFGEVEYRNFTVHGKTKETTVYTVNGADALSTRTTAQIHSNYTDHLDSISNNSDFNTVDSTKPTDELSSYISISGVGLTLGLKYSL
ncbi:outer membrane beta-barrel protein [Flavobacterium sp. LB3P45]|uniref:Outer membrane beta-barrel protein n=1 Tax=Flavobacterium fructosi TaxID=3230416 RepID=A0ABW6HJM1_9FLAO